MRTNPRSVRRISITPQSGLVLRFRSPRPAFSLLFCAAALVGLTVVTPLTSSAVTDNFDDGNDTENPEWTRFEPLTVVGATGEFSFPDGGYRMAATAPPVEDAGPARLFTYHKDSPVTDFFIAVDVVDWDDTLDQAFGILARAGNIGLGQTEGYICNYDPNQDGDEEGDDPGGQFQINTVEGEASSATTAAANVKLIKGHSYRMMFRGVGPVLTAAFYDLADLTSPLALIETDFGDFFEDGFPGLFNFYRGNDVTFEESVPDITWDNFECEESNPQPEIFPAIGRGVPGAVSVIGKSPASYANFYPAGDGLAFTATTFGVGTVDDASIRLELNGQDVTGDIAVAPADDGFTAQYGGLEANTLYRGKITVANAAGAETVHEWVFDTFDSALLESPVMKVVEAEDYNFDKGKFIDDPAVGDYSEAVGEFDVDYLDFDGGTSFYRFDEVTAAVVLDTAGTPPDYGENSEQDEIVRDTVRARYADDEDSDWVVFGTQAGEWLNYTREFEPGSYNVYLRLASRHPQNLLLQTVTGDRTQPNQSVEPVGVFQAPNTVGTRTFIYVPLSDDQGAPLAVDLDGETTLRLVVGGPELEPDQKNTLFLNYLMFVAADGSGVDSGLKITSVARTGTDVTLEWTSVAGRSYAVDFKADLDAATWAEVSDNVVADGAVTTFTDTEPARTDLEKGVYRVRLVE